MINDISKMINNIQQSFKWDKQFDVSLRLADLAKTNNVWGNSIPNYTKLEETFKGLNLNGVINDTIQKRIQELVSNNNIWKNSIPDSTIDAIKAIGKNNTRLFGMWNFIPEDFFANVYKINKFDQLGLVSDMFNKQSSKFNQIINLKISLSDLSSQIAEISAKNKNWDFISNFEVISSEVINLQESIIAKKVISKQEFDELKLSIDSLTNKITNHDPSFTEKILKYFHLIYQIYFIIYFHFHIIPSFYNDLSESVNPQELTIEYMESFKSEIFNYINAKLKENGENRFIRRNTNVYLKPLTNSEKLATIKCESSVIVINIKHKWAYISYVNPNNNITESGWIMKKYLTKSEH